MMYYLIPKLRDQLIGAVLFLAEVVVWAATGWRG